MKNEIEKLSAEQAKAIAIAIETLREKQKETSLDRIFARINKMVNQGCFKATFVQGIDYPPEEAEHITQELLGLGYVAYSWSTLGFATCPPPVWYFSGVEIMSQKSIVLSAEQANIIATESSRKKLEKTSLDKIIAQIYKTAEQGYFREVFARGDEYSPEEESRIIEGLLVLGYRVSPYAFKGYAYSIDKRGITVEW